MAVLIFEGSATMLRAHDPGSGFGPASDKIDGELIFQLDAHPGKSFGFTLRADGDRVAHAAMADLLRDALVDPALRVRADVDIDIDIDIDIEEGKRNGRALRVTLLRAAERPDRGPGVVDRPRRLFKAVPLRPSSLRHVAVRTAKRPRTARRGVAAGRR